MEQSSLCGARFTLWSVVHSVEWSSLLWSEVLCGAKFTLWSKVHSVECGSLCGAELTLVE